SLPTYTPLFILQYYPPHRDLHSFPTRRSSDLDPRCPGSTPALLERHRESAVAGTPGLQRQGFQQRLGPRLRQRCHRPARDSVGRSEEHTSELQSRENLVCRLLLEKKKKKTTKT